VLDDRVRAMLSRLEEEDARERATGLPSSERSRAVERTTGQFLFSLVAPQADCEVLEIGGSRGYSTVWLAAGVRHLGGRVLSLEHDTAKVDDVFDLVFIDAEKADYERLFEFARTKLEAGALVVADNVLSHTETLGAYSQARQADPSLLSVTVPPRPRSRALRRPGDEPSHRRYNQGQTLVLGATETLGTDRHACVTTRVRPWCSGTRRSARPRRIRLKADGVAIWVPKSTGLVEAARASGGDRDSRLLLRAAARRPRRRLPDVPSAWSSRDLSASRTRRCTSPPDPSMVRFGTGALRLRTDW
jgi:predicted O-methyltransferase YrrM